MAVRLQLMGSKAPEFAPADNPSADCSSTFTRALTFLHLPAFNLWLLVQPTVLSFDWSMEAIPLIHNLMDVRNAISAIFYSTLVYASYNLLRKQIKRRRPSSIADDNLISSTPLLFEQPTAPPPPTSNNNGFESSASNCYSSCSASKTYHHNWSSSSSSSSSSNDDIGSSSSRSSSRNSCSTTTTTSGGGGGGQDGGGSFDLTVIALSMLVLPFIPATNLFFYVGFVVAERVLYIPSMGYCLLFAIGYQLIDQRLVKFNQRRRRVILRASLVVLVLFFSARTVVRNQDWLTEESLYRSGISINPPKGNQFCPNFPGSISRHFIVYSFII